MEILNPIDVIIWTCVAVFVITAILTILHVSGIRKIPDENHAKVLFKALVVEVVVIAVSSFGAILLPNDDNTPRSSLTDNQLSSKGSNNGANISTKRKSSLLDSVGDLNIEGTTWRWPGSGSVTFLKDGQVRFSDNDTGGKWSQNGKKVTFDSNEYTIFVMEIEGDDMVGTWRRLRGEDKGEKAYSHMVKVK